MKKITGNTSRFLLGVTILLAVMGISDSCTKKTALDMYGTTVGTKGAGRSRNKSSLDSGYGI